MPERSSQCRGMILDRNKCWWETFCHEKHLDESFKFWEISWTHLKWPDKILDKKKTDEPIVQGVRCLFMFPLRMQFMTLAGLKYVHNSVQKITNDNFSHSSHLPPRNLKNKPAFCVNLIPATEVDKINAHNNGELGGRLIKTLQQPERLLNSLIGGRKACA